MSSHERGKSGDELHFDADDLYPPTESELNNCIAAIDARLARPDVQESVEHTVAWAMDGIAVGISFGATSHISDTSKHEHVNVGIRDADDSPDMVPQILVDISPDSDLGTPSWDVMVDSVGLTPLDTHFLGWASLAYIIDTIDHFTGDAPDQPVSAELAFEHLLFGRILARGVSCIEEMRTSSGEHRMHTETTAPSASHLRADLLKRVARSMLPFRVETLRSPRTALHDPSTGTGVSVTEERKTVRTYENEHEILESSEIREIITTELHETTDGERPVTVTVSKTLRLQAGEPAKVIVNNLPWLSLGIDLEEAVQLVQASVEHQLFETSHSDLCRSTEKQATAGDIRHFKRALANATPLIEQD